MWSSFWHLHCSWEQWWHHHSALLKCDLKSDKWYHHNKQNSFPFTFIFYLSS
jgi:hypothetical protein